MPLLQGSTHTISVVNLKDTAGAAQPLPAGMLPVYTPSPVSLVTMGVQNPDGSQPFTVGSSSGTVTFTGTLTYPDGDQIKLTPISADIAAPEDVTGDLAIS
jgi:hypothetical protein